MVGFLANLHIGAYRLAEINGQLIQSIQFFGNVLLDGVGKIKIGAFEGFDFHKLRVRVMEGWSDEVMENEVILASSKIERND